MQQRFKHESVLWWLKKQALIEEQEARSARLLAREMKKKIGGKKTWQH